MQIKKLLIPLLIFITCLFAFASCKRQEGNDKDTEPSITESEIDKFVENFDRYTDFVDDQTIVILTKEASSVYIFHDYTAEDFSEIGAIDVRELDGATSDSVGITYKIRQCLLEGSTIPAHFEDYTRTFCITLNKKDKDNVLRVIYILRQRADIYLAGPNWIVSGD